MIPDQELIDWGESLMYRSRRGDESVEEFLEEFAHHMLIERQDPVAAREITLRKWHKDWSLDEMAEFVLDYGEWYEKPIGPQAYTHSVYCAMKHVASHRIPVIKGRRTRKAGAVASSAAEMLTMEGDHAVNEFAPRRRDTQWDGAVLSNPPHGFEEALRKRAAFPLDDQDQGPLVVKHLDANGRETVKFIQPKEPPTTVERVPRDRRLVQSTVDGVVVATENLVEAAETPQGDPTPPETPLRPRKAKTK